MELKQNYIEKNGDLLHEKGYSIPEYNRKEIQANTKSNPNWIHFGAGNIFKAFLANAQQNLLNKGLSDKGIIVAEGYDYEIVDKICEPNDNLTILATLKSDGTVQKTVIGSITESLKLDSQDDIHFNRLKEIFANDSLQMASFTITEKGYSLTDSQGNYLKDIVSDFENGPEKPLSYLGKVSCLCYYRYKNGQLPISLVSMDNCSQNGTKLYNAINEFANKWVEHKFVDSGFVNYINDANKVGFPWSMIDKITPRPDDSVKNMLLKDGFKNIEPIVTSKNTYIAPFVNAEETEYLVIQDWFPNGKPNLDKAGIIYTARETVDKVEKMKVCTSLNPLHTALAIFGCLLGYTKISDEMQDKDLLSLVKNLGYVEGLPVVVDPGILSPKEFIDTVINKRFPNPFMPDTPQRIAMDTSLKLSIRFGETIKAYDKNNALNPSSLKSIPLVLAGWCRYLIGVDDNGNKFELTSDPILKDLQPKFNNISLGSNIDAHEVLKDILNNSTIFGVDLYQIGLGEIVESYFAQMVSGNGKVRETIQNHLN